MLSEAEQVPHEGDAGSPTSNPEPASLPEVPEDTDSRLIREILEREPISRNAVIEIYHQTLAGTERIAGSCGLSLQHTLKYLSNARERNDARVVRGDAARLKV